MERELGRGASTGLPAFQRAYSGWLAERIRAGRLVPFIAVNPAGTVLGSGSVWLREDRPHRGDLRTLLPRIHGIYVRPEARRRGVATELVREMLRWIRRQGFRRVGLQTTPRAEAIYARFGFRRRPEMEREWRE
jgi:GNAT superfamily N-acetyltransferase